MNILHVEEILNKFSFLSDVFSRPELKNCLLLMFSICLSPKKTVASMADWLEDIDQSSLNRFLSQSPWNSKELFESYHQEIKKQVQDKVAKLIIDDTKIEKTGDKIQRAGWEFDHCKKMNILCFSLVFSIVKIGNMELPLPFAVESCMKKKHKQKRKRSKITLAMRMIDDFVKLTKEASKRIIIFDSWYCAQKLICAIPEDVYWVTRLKFKDSRLVRLNGCWLPIWKFRRGVKPWNFKKVKVNNHYFFVYKCKLEIKGLGLVTVVISNPSRYSKRYVIFISNLSEAKEILENYEERWEVEVFFRSVKQNFGIGDVQMRKYLGNRRYWSMVLLAYSSISLLQHLWKKTCKTVGETMRRLKKLLQNTAANYGMSLGRFTHFYVCEKIAKL